MIHPKEVCGSYPKSLERDVPPCLCTRTAALSPWGTAELIRMPSSAVVPVVSLTISWSAEPTQGSQMHAGPLSARVQPDAAHTADPGQRGEMDQLYMDPVTVSFWRGLEYDNYDGARSDVLPCARKCFNFLLTSTSPWGRRVPEPPPSAHHKVRASSCSAFWHGELCFCGR